VFYGGLENALVLGDIAVQVGYEQYSHCFVAQE
jgi:hypothetical protein